MIIEYSKILQSIDDLTKTAGPKKFGVLREIFSNLYVLNDENPEGQIPRPPPHLRNHRLAERCGYQDGIRHAWSLLRRFHAGYLCPCYDVGTEGCCRYDRECAGRLVNNKNADYHPRKSVEGF